jgi:DNA repair exonuclease SbcCD ATPase subunit
MAIEFKSLTLQNFLSYGNVPTTVILNKPGTVLILGEDLDNTTSGTGANGCGKTVLLNALVYAMYDKPISDISKDNLVNNINKRNMKVEIEFDVNGKSYKIVRARKMKSGAAGNWVHLYEDNKDITPDNVSNTNDLITKIIGIPYDLFVRIVAFSATHIPFLDLPVSSHYAASQKGIIEELFDLKTLSEKADLLKEHIKSTEITLSAQTEKISLIEHEHERHQNQIEAAEKRVENWKKQNKKDIIDIETKINSIHNIDIDAQKDLHEKNLNIENSINGKNSEKRKLEREIKSITTIINEKTKELTHLKDEKCPYCLQKYADAQVKISENESIITNSNELLEDLNVRLTNITNEIIDLEDMSESVNQDITVSNLDELLQIRSKTDLYHSKLEELKNAVNPYIEPLQDLLNVKLDEIDNTEVNNLTKKIEHQKFLLKLLTKKDSFVRKTLLNKNIPYLNKRLTQYLQDLGLPHTVEFTYEMTANISQFGRTMDFGNLSNGQRARVNLALSFAFRDVLQSMHQQVNVCMLDEVLDVGLDTVGVQNAARMLKRKTRDEGLSMFIISHRDEIDSSFDRKMIVQMSKGFSYLNFDE